MRTMISTLVMLTLMMVPGLAAGQDDGEAARLACIQQLAAQAALFLDEAKDAPDAAAIVAILEAVELDISVCDNVMRYYEAPALPYALDEWGDDWRRVEYREATALDARGTRMMCLDDPLPPATTGAFSRFERGERSLTDLVILFDEIEGASAYMFLVERGIAECGDWLGPDSVQAMDMPPYGDFSIGVRQGAQGNMLNLFAVQVGNVVHIIWTEQPADAAPDKVLLRQAAARIVERMQ